jgi:hypothetical protein
MGDRRRVRAALKPSEILRISRVVTISSAEPALKAISAVVTGEHGLVEIRKSRFFGLDIEHGYIITSQRRQAA